MEETMNSMPQPWDYLIITASNEAQAKAYARQLEVRTELGMLSAFRTAMVVADPQGKRIGSGGSTLLCLMQVLERELPGGNGASDRAVDWAAIEKILAHRRILILHAGGDSRRLPAYGSCGKIFVPVPGDQPSGTAATLFDHLLAAFTPFPAPAAGKGQVVVAAGDALIRFDAGQVRLAPSGVTALGGLATPDEAKKHGVFCAGGDGPVRVFLQKPSVERQRASGAIDADGMSILDVAVMSFGADVSLGLLQTFGVVRDAKGALVWPEAMHERIFTQGLDLYREICCALGSEATVEHLIENAQSSGSAWDEAALGALHAGIHHLPFHVQVLKGCHFLHFGTTRQLITSGLELLQETGIRPPADELLKLTSITTGGGEVAGRFSWVEGCRVSAPLVLDGENVVVGADVLAPVRLPQGACLDVLAGRNRAGKPVWFVRCYGTRDSFKDSLAAGGTLCGKPLAEWLKALGARKEDLWDAALPAEKCTLWDARVFPAVERNEDFQNWLWLFGNEPTPQQAAALLAADRYSTAEMAMLADQEVFHTRRIKTFAQSRCGNLARLMRKESEFSAEDLALTLKHGGNRAACLAELLGEARRRLEASGRGAPLEAFQFCRILHSLGTAVAAAAGDHMQPMTEWAQDLAAAVPAETAAWLASLDPSLAFDLTPQRWAEGAWRATFAQQNAAIFRSAMTQVQRPRCALKPDETVWGRAPARLELGGGWTDTPPYTLERGGSVANTAINLNGQPPIHCFARMIEEPVLRLGSIDTGNHIVVRSLEELLDYRRPSDPFALVKASLAVAGFSPEMADWADGVTLADMLAYFGGGIELTTLVGIPKGSGLGTSSLLGAAVVSVIQRMFGHAVNMRRVFHDVLRLEQAMTTGGGWQDQVGGGVGGSKITSTAPGMFPDPCVRHLPSDLLDPAVNGGSTLIYYVGLTRLAKNILQQVVGGYYNRNRSVMASLQQEHIVAQYVADALLRKDAEAFGHYVNEAWRLQKQLCGEVTNEVIESLLERVHPHIFGARISGAGSGGFLIMICKSPGDAAKVRADLEAKPLNDRSRFFDFQINHQGLEVATH